jgi:hypothetical protein
MDTLLVAVICLTNIACFIVGAKVGQTVSRGEVIETPTIDPFKAYREHEAKREAEREQDRIDTIMQNIENYDGTSNGQKDVPGR